MHIKIKNKTFLPTHFSLNNGDKKKDKLDDICADDEGDGTCMINLPTGAAKLFIDISYVAKGEIIKNKGEIYWVKEKT